MSRELAPLIGQFRQPFSVPGWPGGDPLDLPDDEVAIAPPAAPVAEADPGSEACRQFHHPAAGVTAGGTGDGLRALCPDVDPQAFMAQLQSVPCAALLLDYDGTLAPFVRDPAAAHPWPGVLARLQAIAALPRVRLCLVTGRPAIELLPLLDLPQRPEIWGAHGWERLHPDGRMEVRVLAATARNALVEAAHRVADLDIQGVRLEKKPASLALHWRGLPAAEVRPLRQWVEQAWRPLTRTDGEGELALLPFDGGIELRLRECSKALAVGSVLEELPPGSACAYLGDDITDEDAFAALAPLGARGLPVLVRARLRPTGARAWLQPPAGLLEFLDQWQARLAR